jgi:DNA-binding response OmpR family regulator
MRILVVDDWPDGAASWVLLFRFVGFQADAATDGRQALEIAHAHRPDVAILDINLPDMDGYELAVQLRLLYPDRLAIIAISAVGDRLDTERSRQAKFDLELTKPADLQQVLSFIAGAFGQTD